MVDKMKSATKTLSTMNNLSRKKLHHFLDGFSDGNKRGSFLLLIQLDLISRVPALCLSEIAPAGRSLIKLQHQTL